MALLGPAEVEGDVALAPREKAVLVALAVRSGQVVSPDQFADALWGQRPPSTWPKQLQACVVNLRKVLGAAAVETTVGGYRLRLGDDDLDVHRFERLVTAARTYLVAGEPERAVATFARALALWRGRRSRSRRMVSRAERGDAARRVAPRRRGGPPRREAGCRRAPGGGGGGEPLVAAEPLRERRWAILALAQYRCGRQADALRTLERARRTLVEQLGVDPGRELVELQRAILSKTRRSGPVRRSRPPTPACPYKGLEAYDVDDHDSFFGRDGHVIACLERLRTHRLLVVTGASGCGKSSLVRAGLVPALARAGRPGGRDRAGCRSRRRARPGGADGRPEGRSSSTSSRSCSPSASPPSRRVFCAAIVERARRRAR